MPLSPVLFVLASASLTLADGCQSSASSSSTPASAEAQVTAVQDTFTRILSQNSSGYPESAEVVIRDRAALEAAWRALHAGNQVAELPAVDFGKSTLVLIALGGYSTGGHALRVDRVTRQGDAAVVHYTVTRPGPSCMTTQAITSPVELISMPRAAGEVRFQQAVVVEPC
jgi:hypothetical protein